jgi:hypothetical protein
MRKLTLRNVAVCSLLSILLLQSCKDDAELLERPAIANQSFIEEFDTVSVSLARGWQIKNASTPVHAATSPLLWQQGGDVVPWFSAFSSNGSYQGFIGASAELTTALPPGVTPVISNWLISPAVTMQNGDKIIFYTRTRFATSTDDYGNRLQLRANLLNESTNVGSGNDAGDFTTGLVDINPTYASQKADGSVINAYPANWTRFEATITGLNEPKKGRFAFRYYINDGNAFGWGIGLDKVQYISVNHK